MRRDEFIHKLKELNFEEIELEKGLEKVSLNFIVYDTSNKINKFHIQIDNETLIYFGYKHFYNEILTYVLPRIKILII